MTTPSPKSPSNPADGPYGTNGNRSPLDEALSEDRRRKTTHLTYYKCKRPELSKAPPEKRPLVLIFQWLYAKPTSVKKYIDLYHQIGLDVLAIRGKLSHFLWPPVGKQLCVELFEYLHEYRPPHEKLLIHAFSVGAYNYTIAMEAAEQDEQETGYFRDRVVGQIFDSIVIGSYENLSSGLEHVRF